MKTGMLVLIGTMVAMSGCATRFVQDVTIHGNELIVKECVLINHEVWPQDCVERKYPVK